MFFTPYQIKNVELKNRSVMAPMCMYEAGEDGIARDFHLIHYATRAIGGIALVIVEATAVTPDGRISRNDLGLWSDEHVPGMKKIVKGIKDNGSVPGIQINHAGRKAKTDKQPIGPSPIPFYDYEPPREMTTQDIADIILAFKEAARRADEAGYEYLEIHGAHGYLIFEFLSPLSNQRKDKYGDGAIFLKEVIEAIKTVWPKDKLLGLRISAYEYHDKGLQVDDAVNIINRVKDLGIDLVHVSSGGNVMVTMKPYPGYQLGFAATIKEKTGLPTIGGGLITDLKMAEHALRTQQADFIFFGRPLLREPYFVLNHADEIGHEITWPKPYERGKK